MLLVSNMVPECGDEGIDDRALSQRICYSGPYHRAYCVSCERLVHRMLEADFNSARVIGRNARDLLAY